MPVSVSSMEKYKLKFEIKSRASRELDIFLKNGTSQPQAPHMSVMGAKTPILQKLQPTDFPENTFPHIMYGITESQRRPKPPRSFFFFHYCT